MRQSTSAFGLYAIYLLRISLFFLIVSFLYRLMLSYFWGQMDFSADFYTMLWTGTKFDYKILAFGSVLPFLLVSVNLFLSKTISWIRHVVFGYLWLMISSFFLIYLIDIPYFNFYNCRLNNGILTWTDSFGAALKVMLFDWRYILISLVWIALGYGVFRLLRWFIPNKLSLKSHWLVRITSFLTVALLIFIGMRGSVNPTSFPLETEDAFFSTSTEKNQLTINPIFNFIASFGAYDLVVYPTDEEAFNALSSTINVAPADLLRRDMVGSGNPQKKNVILIIVESLSAHKVDYYGMKQGLTPNLDSIQQHSLFYPNMFTDGIHTHNGLYSLLYGFSNVLNDKAFISSKHTGFNYTSMPYTLAKNGYDNAYFCSGSTRFDNMDAFFKSNAFHHVYGGVDYPKEWCTDAWGISDQHLFRYVTDYYDDFKAKNPDQPFFATIMTISTHEGSNYQKCDTYPHREGLSFEDQSYAYMDWCIGEFVRENKNKSWFKESIVIITGDHGQNFDAIYDIPIAYHHVPLYVFAGDGSIPAQLSTQFVQQHDVFPLVMHYLDIPYVNNTLGMNPLTYQRPYAYFTTDDEIGCISEDWFMVERINGAVKLFDYKNHDLKDFSLEHPRELELMRNYTYMYLQGNNFMLSVRESESH